MGIEPPCAAPAIPSKSRSLRAGSVQKRLETELKLKGSRKSGLSSRAARMTKYRRKTANAKERDRMKLLNVAFDRLRSVMPDVKSITKEDKDTKVTMLRAAISYISGLQSLLADCEAGLVDPALYPELEEAGKGKVEGRPAKQRKKTTSGGRKPVVGGRGGEGRGRAGGGAREERAVPVTLSMKTETVFTKLLGGGGGGGLGGVKLNLLSLQPLPLSSLQPPSPPSLPSPPPSLPSPASSLPSPPPSLPHAPSLPVGPKGNLAKQEVEPCVGRQSPSTSSSSSPSSPDDVDMDMDDEDEDDTDLVPTIDQLFQRSFSFELRDEWGEGELVLLESLLHGDRPDMLLLEEEEDEACPGGLHRGGLHPLEDIAAIIGTEAGARLLA